jgi:hypothetical protein
MSNVHQTILKRDANGNVIQESYTGDMAFLGEYTGANLIYKAFARPGALTSVAKWQIAKLTYSGANVTAIQWPQDTLGHASSEFNFIWDNRASYTYS